MSDAVSTRDALTQRLVSIVGQVSESTGRIRRYRQALEEEQSRTKELSGRLKEVQEIYKDLFPDEYQGWIQSVQNRIQGSPGIAAVGAPPAKPATPVAAEANGSGRIGA